MSMFLIRNRTRELAVFCRQFAALAAAGIPILPALTLLAEQTGEKGLRKAVYEVKYSVENGNSLADSMRKKKQIFSPLFISVVKAGEESGRLALSLEQMAVHYEKTARLKDAVQKAMVYPMVLMLTCIAVILLLFFFLLPMYSELFEELEMELPANTEAVQNLGRFAGEHWLPILFILLLTGLGFSFLMRTQKGAFLAEHILLRVPHLGKLRRLSACAHFARTLGMLLGAGVLLPEALDLISEVMERKLWKSAVRDTKHLVMQGVSLADALRMQKLFPPILCHMISVGEESGSLERMLSSAASYYEEESAACADLTESFLEPMLVLLMTVIVCAVISVVYSPILALYDGLEFL